MEAAVEQKRQDEALMREFQIAQEAVTVWARANPNDPLAQRVIAALLEVSQTPGAMEDEVRLKQMAEVMIAAYNQLEREGRLPIGPAPEIKRDPTKRNSMIGGEEPVW